MVKNLAVKVDRITCQGYGNCVIKSPKYFDLDDDGLVFIPLDGIDHENDFHMAPIDPEDLADVEEAVRSCPVSALTIVEVS